MQIYINGKFYAKENAMLSVFDHGLLYGDGVFETLRIYNNIVFKIREHLDRLFNSAKTINLQIPLSKSQLKNAIEVTIKRNNLKDAYVRVTITRGVGDIGYNAKCRVNVIIIAKEIPQYSKDIHHKGISVITYNAERFLPRVKSTNCLPLVMAKNLAEKKGCFEALLVDNRGYVTEGTVSNIFFVRKFNEEIIIYTPTGNLLYGITRGFVIELSKKKFEVKETKIKKQVIYDFDEAFLTNTTAEIVPVVRIDNKKIGSGLPGDVTKYFIGEYRCKTHEINKW
ncbi:MAG: aminotransferase class IV [Nanoarchaeota archaeon]